MGREGARGGVNEIRLSLAEHARQIDLDGFKGRDAGTALVRERADDTEMAAVELMGDQGAILGPHQAVKRNRMALQQLGQEQGVLVLVTRRDNLAHPIRREVDDAVGQAWQALSAPAGEFVRWALVGLIGDANLRADPLTARIRSAVEGPQLARRAALRLRLREPEFIFNGLFIKRIVCVFNTRSVIVAAWISSISFH
ncbi:hypothetical protein [Thiocapsa sp.]|uniref:hypothetical protein n=1 Tax=Thiocapsa sp. TaxID=2024551 RepID=UPI002BF839D7|nr:hypothetical protein [Thiocapsa sp.]HSO81696.1 hypothetical protein [Thiocapsa sp.]